jgi:hypothetical protein
LQPSFAAAAMPLLQVHSRFRPVINAGVMGINLDSSTLYRRRKFLPFLKSLIGLREVAVDLKERPANHLAALVELGLREHMPASVRELDLQLALPMVRRRPSLLI